MNADSDGEIAYLLAEMPDRSETFAAEVHQLALTGVKLHVFSLVPRAELPVLEVLAAAAIPLTCVPCVTPLSTAASAPSGIGRLAALAALHWRLLRRRTRAYLATWAAVVAMSWKSRSGPSICRRQLVEDFLLGVEIAVSVLEAGTVRHLHGHEGNRTSTRAWLVSRLTGLSFSFTASTSALPDSGLERALLEQQLRESRFIATRSEAARTRLTQTFPEAGAIHTVYHGVNVQYFSPRPAPQAAQAPVILCVGRFEENSGFEYMIAACAQLKAAGTACRCWLVGPEGTQSGAILRAIETLGVSDCVSTYGSVTPVQLRHLLHHASVFVLPRVELADAECFPEGLAEAMATGIPVVATPIGIIPEILEHMRNAILLAGRDSRALARILQALLHSAALRHRLGRSGRQKACQALDIRVTAALLKRLFDTLVPGAMATPDIAEDGYAPPRRLRLLARLDSRRKRLLQTVGAAHADSTPSGAVPVE